MAKRWPGVVTGYITPAIIVFVTLFWALISGTASSMNR
jgi:hypothetical protein